jgi:hypothetical protein
LDHRRQRCYRYMDACACVWWKTMGNTVDRGNSFRSSTPTALGCGSRPNVTKCVAQHKLVSQIVRKGPCRSARPQRRPGLRQSHCLNVLHRVLQSTLACFSCSALFPSLVQASGDSGRSMQCSTIQTRFNGLVP